MTIFQLILFLQNELGTTIFEKIANTCYDMLDHQKSYRRFLAAMKLLHVPVQTPNVKTDMQPTAAVTTGEYVISGSQIGRAEHAYIDISRPISYDLISHYHFSFLSLFSTWQICSREQTKK